MRSTAIPIAVIFSFAVSAAGAAVPNSVAVLIGPDIGYLMSQSDLCQWGMSAKVQATYQQAFRTMGMTVAQQAAAWDQAKARQADLAKLPADAKARMKADTCTPEAKAHFEHNLAD
jgi:hypothetical protein